MTVYRVCQPLMGTVPAIHYWSTESARSFHNLTMWCVVDRPYILAALWRRV